MLRVGKSCSHLKEPVTQHQPGAAQDWVSLILAISMGEDRADFLPAPAAVPGAILSPANSTASFRYSLAGKGRGWVRRILQKPLPTRHCDSPPLEPSLQHGFQQAPFPAAARSSQRQAGECFREQEQVFSRAMKPS